MKVLDTFLMQKGKLAGAFKAADHLEKPEQADGQVSFDAFYDALSNWGKSQILLTYEELSLAESNP